jgi:hypothetical protein
MFYLLLRLFYRTMDIIMRQGGILMSLPIENTEGKEYTVDYIYSLPDGVRAELIDGIVYDIAFPNTIHQILVGRLTSQCHLVKNDMNANYTKIKPGVHLIGFIFCNYTYLD